MIQPSFVYLGDDKIYLDFNLLYTGSQVGQPGFSRTDFNCTIAFPDPNLDVSAFSNQVFKTLQLMADVICYVTYDDPVLQAYYPQDFAVDISSPSGLYPLQIGNTVFDQCIISRNLNRYDISGNSLSQARAANIVAAQIGRGALPVATLVDTGTTAVSTYLRMRITGFKSDVVGRLS